VVITAHQVDPYGRFVRYRIRVQGRLGAHWAACFDGLTIKPDTDGTTAIEGPVADQAALHGVLHKVRDLGLSLESVDRIPASTDPVSPGSASTINDGPGEGS
jgi:hypothetical protein